MLQKKKCTKKDTTLLQTFDSLWAISQAFRTLMKRNIHT